MLPVKSVIRLGSITPIENVVSKGGDIVEINTIEAVTNSANKLLMKQCFVKAGINTANWFLRDEKGIFWAQKGLDEKPIQVATNKLPYPILAKSKMGSRGRGNYKLNSEEELKVWLEKKHADSYIFERYYPYAREYRLHVTADGCFYPIRKMLKADSPKDKSWQRHDDNCVWYIEDNKGFDKPVNWDEIVAQCMKALSAVGLDIASFDVRVQSTLKTDNTPRANPEFIIIECNSASSFGKITAEKYKSILPPLILKKAIEYGLYKPKPTIQEVSHEVPLKEFLKVNDGK